MYLRDMPLAWQRETTGNAVRVGYNHCPPRLLTILSPVARPSSFAIKPPAKPPVLLQGLLQPLSPISGLTKRRPLEPLTPSCSAQLLP